MTDKRELAKLFRERVGQLIAREGGGLAGFARSAGFDRSALSQFMDPGSTRLPRAETLRRIAEAKGVALDWLLGLSNAEQARVEVAPSVEIEQALDEAGNSPLERWRLEALGYKIRYVPATLPDSLRLPQLAGYEFEAARAEARLELGASVLASARPGETDMEICMPAQTLTDLAQGTGIWTDLDPRTRKTQLAHMADLVERHYPLLRLHLFDGRRTFSAPYTVFGAIRAALYLGRSYLVVTDADQVRALARHFDGLVREATVGPDRAAAAIRAELDQLAGAG